MFNHELNFEGGFARQVEDGSTILALVPPTRSRPPAVGQPVALFNAGRVKAIKVANVVVRARLILTPTGVARVLRVAFDRPNSNGPDAALIWRLLETLEQPHSQSASTAAAFARLAGFPGEESYNRLYLYHKATEDIANRRTPRGRIVRELIGWEAVR